MLSKSPQKTSSKVRYIGQGSLFIMKKRGAYRSKGTQKDNYGTCIPSLLLNKTTLSVN